MKKENDGPEVGTGHRPETRGELLKEKAFRLFGKTYIALPTLILILLWVGTTPYYLTQIYEVDPLEQKLSESQKKIEDLESLNQSLTSARDALMQESEVMLRNKKRPVPISPIRKKAVIGPMVRFRWAYKGGEQFTNYVLEIQPTGREGVEPLKYQVPDPGRRTLHFELDPRWVGKIFWRVRPGPIVEDSADQRELWSYHGSFVVYRSIMHRIRTTGKLIVGTTPAFLSYDHPIDDQSGLPDSFDMNLIYWIGQELSEHYDLPRLKIELRSIPWEKLLESVRTHDVDLAIGTITKSKQRERAVPGLKFSQGYLQNHQILIEYARPVPARSVPQGDFWKFLKGKRVGVQNETINEKAARVLSKKYGFEVIDNLASYVDVYDALRYGNIDFGMIDSVRQEMVRNEEFRQFGPYLDEYLKEFYTKELEEANEEYAIAVADDRRSDESLLRLVDGILKEAQGKGGKLEELKTKFFKPEEE